MLACAVFYVLPCNVVARSSGTDHEYPFPSVSFGTLEPGGMNHFAFELLLRRDRDPTLNAA
jgi:hypothetical protein